MDLKEISINTKNWVDSAQDSDYSRALVNAPLNLQVSYVMVLDDRKGMILLKAY
jgi:hypothetical protein